MDRRALPPFGTRETASPSPDYGFLQTRDSDFCISRAESRV